MGAEYREAVLDAMTEQELHSEFEGMKESAMYRSGMEYSGDWNMCEGVSVHEQVFFSENDARDYAFEHAEKWGNVVAVKLLNKSVDIKKSALFSTIEKLEKRASDAEAMFGGSWNIGSVHKVALIRVQSGKSQKRTCKRCESSISVKHLKSVRCPVCGNDSFVLNNQDKQKIAKARAEHEALIEQIENLKKLAIEEQRNLAPDVDWDTPNSSWRWYIGGWCAC